MYDNQSYPPVATIQNRVKDTVDYVVDKHTGNNLILLGDMLSYAKDWPATVSYKGNTFIFKTQEVMPQAACGHFHGCARYELYDPYKQQDNNS